MTQHPKARRPALSRREFMKRTAAAGVAVPSLAAILAACGSGAQSSVDAGPSSTGAGGGANPYGTGGIGGAPYPLARLDSPVTWNILDDNPAIASDLPPEKGATLKIFNWNYYLSKSVMRAFEKKYDVTVEETHFNEMAQAVSKIRSGQADFDLLFGLQIYEVGKLIAGGYLQPINHDYIPNFATNVWDAFQSPFYDQQSRFTMPYSIWDTGIMWRNDEISTDIAGLANPYDVFWDDAPKDKTHLLSNSRDPLAMAMMRRGLTDLNTDDPTVIDQAKTDIQEVVKATNAQFDHEDYTDIPSGKAWLHQSWSGNVGSAFLFLPEGDTAQNVSYYWPGATSGVSGNVDNDTVAVLKSATNPVLAHAFIDFIYDDANALANYTGYTGYQMPINSITPDSLVGNEVVPEHLATTVVRVDDFAAGYRILELAPDVAARGGSAYQEIQAGV